MQRAVYVIIFGEVQNLELLSRTGSTVAHDGDMDLQGRVQAQGRDGFRFTCIEVMLIRLIPHEPYWPCP